MGESYFLENSGELLILRGLNYFKIRDSNGWFWELRGWQAIRMNEKRP